MFPCILMKLPFLGNGNTYPAHFMTRSLSSRMAVLLYLSQMKTEIILEDPEVIISTQRDRSTRARFHSVSQRPLKSLWCFKLLWELHKIIQGVSQEEVWWRCLVYVSARGCVLPSVLRAAVGTPLQLEPSGLQPPTHAGSAPALCQLGTEQEAEQLH